MPTLNTREPQLPCPPKPWDLYSSFCTVLDIAKGRRKGVDGDGKEVGNEMLPTTRVEATEKWNSQPPQRIQLGQPRHFVPQ